ncbi:MAG: 2,5-diamino-6-(ribosylamino)-4(3H)-pyrimidinone 5'-phosphate reductase [Chaenotheca gracillima]|nr:MAG: 2,5-diamino-6-(ribosylamino)-4(3H)-pyrimidinone 5'-phosphate reductase [Chaenotheca gracillima]
MSDIMRDAPFGQIVRLLTKNKYFKYPEEKEDFQCPHSYKTQLEEKLSSDGIASSEPKETLSSVDGVTAGKAQRTTTVTSQRERGTDSDSNSSENAPEPDLERQITGLERMRTETLPYTAERMEVERELALEKTKTRPVEPVVTSNGITLADWYTTDDPANPQNWSPKKKAFVAFEIDLYTFAVYAGSAIYTSSTLGVMEQFGVGEFKATLGLALYVLGYGLGPLLWAPMSEIPLFGRNVPYVATFGIYLILTVPTALANNLGGLLFLRFLQGFFGSPCLANGGASMGDMYSFVYLPYSVALWVSAAFAAPALGPLLSAFAVTAKGWRWSLWIILWMSAPVFVLWFFFLPETSHSNILLRRAARLRAKSGNEKIRSQTEIDRAKLTFREIAVDAVIKPVEIMFKDPAVLFTNVYTAITYGIYYSFFEAFPLVYGPLYGFNLGETSIVFLCIVVGCLLAMVIYFSYLTFILVPDILKNGFRSQEHRLKPALYAVFWPTIGLFLFGWTAKTSIHWIASVVGITIYSISVYIILQCIFTYIPMSYPQYAASLFAGNDLCRSAFAFGAILFGRPLFINLGIGKGVSLLGGLSVIGIIGMYALYWYGAKLRARSKFAVS